MICKTCNKNKLKFGIETKLKIISSNEILKLEAFKDICNKCAKLKLKNWKIKNNHKPKSSRGGVMFWSSIYPEFSEKILNKDKGKGTLNHFLSIGKTKKDYKIKNSKLSVGEKTYKSKGFSKEEIIERKNLHSLKSLISKETLIKKYGKINGTKRWLESKQKKKNNSIRNINHWINKGYSEKEAKEQLRIVQSRGLDFYIKKYGKRNGKLKYEKYNYEKTKHMRLSYNVEKYGLEEGKKKLEALFRKQNSIPFSKFEKEVALFFTSLVKDKNNIHSSLTKQFYLFIKDEDKMNLNINPKDFTNNLIIPDICYKNIIIECDGDYWHKNTNLKDNYKKLIYNQLGYKVFRILESNWKKNKELEKNKLIKVINELNKKGSFINQ